MVIDKKSKGSKAEPDRALKEKLCKKAVELVLQLLQDLKNGVVEGMNSPEKSA